MAQIDTGAPEGHGKHGKKKRAKKLSTRIDMTPMVDLAFLLLTFFVLTSTFSKPKVLRMIFPEKIDKKDPNYTPPKVKKGLTLILSKENKIFWYEDKLDMKKPLEVTDYSKEGLRKMLKEKNFELRKKLADIQKESDRLKKGDTAGTRKIEEKLAAAQKESKFLVIVKHDENATYANMIDVVDEFLIAQVGKYFVADDPITKEEKKMVDDQLKK